MNKSTIKNEINRLENAFLDSKNRTQAELTNEWAKKIGDFAGVYGWFENGKLVYVGESGSVWKRLNDVRRTKHHSLRRKLGKERFKRCKGFEPATTKKSFVPNIERKLDALFRTFEVCVVEVPFGRKEFEEHIYSIHRPKYNSRGQRGT